MTDSELISLIQSHRRDSLGHESGDLSQQRAKAMDHYHGRPYGNEVDGRSQVVSRDLAETVDWAMPVLMRTFVQSGNIAEFDPVGEEDEPQAQQESDYMHQVLMKDNAGVMFIHDTLKEALLLKNCYGKHWWDVTEKTTTEEYSGLSMDEITQMMTKLESEDAEVEVTESESQTIEVPGFPPIELFDIELKITRKTKRVKLMAVPVEEVRVSKKCRGSLQDSPFVEHVTKKTRSDLLEMGMPRSFVDSLPAYGDTDNSTERIARDTVTDESPVGGASSVNDKSMDEVEFCEAYIRVDYDGDGKAELRKVVTVANKIPPGEEWNEEIEACALTGGVIKRVPHRHVGESLDDELADLQEIMTTLKRQLNDNIYQINNSEKAVNERVNLKDVLTTLPGGIKRVKGMEPVAGAIMPIVTPSIIGDLMPVLDFYNKSKESRSGIRPGSDMDPDILRETTKGAFMEHLNRASQKIELIARLYAESFLKEVVLQTHGLTVRHQDRSRMVQLRGKWVDVNPQEWRERTDITVRVGLGTGNEEEKRQKLSMLWQMQAQLMQAAVQAPPPVYAKMYEVFADLCESMGFLPEKYAIAPNSPEYQQMQQSKPQVPPEVAAEQAKLQAHAQIEQAKGQMTMQVEQMKLQQEAQLEQMRMQMQAEVDRNRQQAEAQQHALKVQQDSQLEQLKAQYEQDRHMRDMEFQRWKAELDAATNVEVANVMSKNKIADAATAAATGEIDREVRP